MPPPPPPPAQSIAIGYPSWLSSVVQWNRTYSADESKMRVAITLARENVIRETGGPFGAAIFESETGRLVSVGMNSVVRLNNAALHGEMVAFMMAQARVESYTLAAPGMPVHELVTSCAPCAMCLGAILWSGVKRVVCGARREDATRLAFDEGPVFPASYHYLEQRGIRFVDDVLREEAVAVLELYRARKGPIYNA